MFTQHEKQAAQYVKQAAQHEKEAAKKLVSFIVIVSGTFLLCLQLGVLLNEYASNKKVISHGVSEEDAPMPTLRVCTETANNVNQQVLDNYNIDVLHYNGERDEIGRHWKYFPWKTASLKQFYYEAAIFPISELISCHIGEDYSCTQMEGAFHKWTNKLQTSQSCSILTTTLKVPYGETMSVQVNFYDKIRSYKMVIELQNAGVAFVQYMPKHTYGKHKISYQNINGGQMSRYTVEKYNYQPDEGDQSCAVGADIVKCQENCMEEYLMQANSSCVLPWMTIAGEECHSVDGVLDMIDREKIISLDCDCKHPCTQYRYTYDTVEEIASEDTTYSAGFLIDNLNGVITLEERYLYMFFDFIANCGGCISVFGTFSLLWMLHIMLETLFTFLEKERQSQIVVWWDVLKKCLTYTLTLLCTGMFLYQGYKLVDGYIDSTISKRVDIEDPEVAPIPTVMICNPALNSWFLTDVIVTGLLPAEYEKQLYLSPRIYMTHCTVDNMDCMKDSGASYSWSTLYLVDSTCELISFNNNNNSKPVQFYVEFENTFSYLNFDLVDKDALSRYGDSYDSQFMFMLYPHHAVKAIYSTTSSRLLPPCTDNYQNCKDSCWETEFVKYDMCTPPTMPAFVKYVPCRYLNDFLELTEYMVLSFSTIPKCNCYQPCHSHEFIIAAGGDVTATYEEKARLTIGLVPLSYTKYSEEWTQNVNNLVAEIGGTLGVLTGASFLQIGLLVLTLMETMVKKLSISFSRLTSAVDTSLYFIVYGFFFHQVFISFAYYGEQSVHANLQIPFNRPFQLPRITICMDFDRFLYDGSKRILAMSPIRDGVVKYVDPTEEDYERFWDYYPYEFDTVLSQCSVFGADCRNKTGPIHEWIVVNNTNKYCSRLEIQTVNMDEFTSNEIYLGIQHSTTMHLSMKGEDAVTQLQDVLGDYAYIPLYYVNNYNLYGTNVLRLKDKTGNCNNDIGYSTYNCWSECLNNFITDHFGCYYPWMKSVPGMDLCRTVSDYNYKPLLQPWILGSCKCSRPCENIRYNLDLESSDLLSYDFAEVIIKVHNRQEVLYESWAYPLFKLLAELGGCMSLFTGLTLYDIFFSRTPIIMKVCYFLANCFRIGSHAFKKIRKQANIWMHTQSHSHM